LVSLAIEKDRILQSGAWEPTIIKTDNEGVWPATVSPRLKVSYMKRAATRPTTANPSLARQCRQPLPYVRAGRPVSLAHPAIHVGDLVKQHAAGIVVHAADMANLLVKEATGAREDQA